MNIEIGDLLLNLGISNEALILLIAIQFPIWVWSVVYVARKRTEEPTDRIVWLLVILFLGILGTILYFAFGRQDNPESELESEEDMQSFEEWKSSDPSRSYLSEEDQRLAFEADKRKTPRDD